MVTQKVLSVSLIAAGSVLAGMGFTQCGPAQQHKSELPDKPNILIFYADDVGYGDIGCYGAIGVETPHIDRLAAHGVKFTDAHCAAATCSPNYHHAKSEKYRSGYHISPPAV